MNTRMSLAFAIAFLLLACNRSEPTASDPDKSAPSAAAPATMPSPPAIAPVALAAPTETAPAGAADGFKMPTNLQSELSGLKYAIETEGTGVQPTPGQMVAVKYTGWLTDGTQFDKSPKGKPFKFKLGAGQVIDGWDQGIAMMKVGGKRWLVIPPLLGYGEGGAPPDIPGNATLVFHVEMVGVR